MSTFPPTAPAPAPISLAQEQQENMEKILVAQTPIGKGHKWGPLAMIVLNRMEAQLEEIEPGVGCHGLQEAIAQLETGGFDDVDEAS